MSTSCSISVGSSVAVFKPSSKVCVSNITDMTDALRGARWFEGDISAWDVSNVTDMNNMFRKAKKFNADISAWEVNNVTNMSRMFFRADVFDADISNWDVSSVTRMNTMFKRAGRFNADLSGWNVSNVTSMDDMFRAATQFSADLSGWCVTNIASKPTGFDANSGLTSAQLPAWGTCGGSAQVGQDPKAQGIDDEMVQSERQGELRAVPNPTGGVFELSAPRTGTYTLFNEWGKALETGEVRMRYDLSNQPAGMYMLMLQSGETVEYLKVIKH